MVDSTINYNIRQPDTVRGSPLAALATQVGGTHYKSFKIQPVEYIHANNIPFLEGNSIKYISRWRTKGGIADLDKAIHCINLLKELERETMGNLGSNGAVHVGRSTTGAWGAMGADDNVSGVRTGERGVFNESTIV